MTDSASPSQDSAGYEAPAVVELDTDQGPLEAAAGATSVI